MFSTLNSRLPQSSSLRRLLQTTGLSLALMTASAAGVYAESVTIQGAPGANGADGVNPGDSSQPGGDGESVTANAGSGITSPLNKATAIGGLGGAGGSGPGAPGGKGGDAGATATTTIVSGLAEADAISVGGMGGGGGGQSPTGNSGQNAAQGGTGGSATADAGANSGTGNATAFSQKFVRNQMPARMQIRRSSCHAPLFGIDWPGRAGLVCGLKSECPPVS